jgi:hypothetical protein
MLKTEVVESKSPLKKRIGAKKV